jgi:hypothetical protein
VNRDCVGKLCDRNTCVPVHCTDDETNEGESDENCGGPCAPCEAGQACRLPGDCTSRVCTTEVCAAPACDDSVVNGEETDLDCGGMTCSPCADSLACLVGTDCENGVCQGGTCQEATCTDSVKNGAEANADCGGGCPIGCLDGEPCLEASDCTSGVCAETCQAPTCDDKVANGIEPDADCGGDCPKACLTGQGCRIHDDCVTGACVDRECTATLQLLYRSASPHRPNFIEPFLQIRNTGPTAVALSQLELRYFYTSDGAENEIVDCYFAQPDCKDVQRSTVGLKPPALLADRYLSLKFAATAGSIAVNGTIKVQSAVYEPHYADYDQAGDYSYDASKTAYTPHDKVCLYRNGVLIWGVEPSL